MRSLQQRLSRAASAVGRKPRLVMNARLFYLYSLWALTLLDLHFFLGIRVARPLGQIGTLMYFPLIALMLIQVPMQMGSKQRSWYLHPAFLTLVGVAIITTPLAVNKLYARAAAQYLLVYYVLSLATLLWVKKAVQALPIIALMSIQYVWWMIWGQARAQVLWHPSLNNFDAFGGLMVGGAGICFWFGMAAQTKKLKLYLFGMACYCVLGVVASFARGAFLSLVCVGGVIWLRSPRKVLTAFAALGGLLVILAASAVLFPGGAFWAEISSAFSEGASEGTGGQRMILWSAAVEVWKHHPFIGVGGGNFGAFAASTFRQGQFEQFPTPSMFYGFNLHNAYFQILSEFGLVGVFSFLAIMWDFLKRNRALRDPAAVERWKVRTGGGYDLRYLSLGLEAANLANFMSGVFYASLYMPWFFCTWAVSRMLYSVTRPDPGEPVAGGAPGRGVAPGRGGPQGRGNGITKTRDRRSLRG